jgi:adenylate cyclase
MSPGPRTFRTKLLLLFVSVVAVALFATWFRVRDFNDKQARRLINADLTRAAETFATVVAARNQLQIAVATIAARDHQFKELYAEGDFETLASALKNIEAPARSRLVAAVSPEGRVLAPAATQARVETGLFTQLIALALATPTDMPTATGYGFIDGNLHSLVLVPLRAPDIIGWIALGFQIDGQLAAELKQQTDIDLTFLDRSGRPLATTLSAAMAADLGHAAAQWGGEANTRELSLAGESALVNLRPLRTGSSTPAWLALQYSLAEKLAPARALQDNLLLVALGSLVVAMALSLGFARTLTRPIEELVGHTQRIARGEYTVRNTSYRQDELGHLSRAFDDMSRGLAERDRVRAERDRVRDLLDKYRDLLDKNVSPEVAAQQLRDGTALGGEEREVTILFADLRGFTTLSESLAPHDLLTLLNRYLDRMSTAIEAQGGVIDKYIGDAIMALFGAPVTQGDAADRAIAAARGMEQALAALNAELAAEGRAPLAIGVGINTAPVVAGIIGSNRRLNYSVIGDGVNVAARLQAQTRKEEYATNIIVSAATKAAARAPFSPRALGTVPLKGRSEPVEIFAVDP